MFSANEMNRPVRRPCRGPLAGSIAVLPAACTGSASTSKADRSAPVVDEQASNQDDIERDAPALVPPLVLDGRVPRILPWAPVDAGDGWVTTDYVLRLARFSAIQIDVDPDQEWAGALRMRASGSLHDSRSTSTQRLASSSSQGRKTPR